MVSRFGNRAIHCSSPCDIDGGAHCREQCLLLSLLQGWVETTYVDESFRIGHGDKGSIFITSKTKGQEQK